MAASGFNPQQFQQMLKMGAIGQMGGGIGDLFAANDNPADSAMPYLDRIKGELGNAFNPYMDAGKSAMGDLQGRYGNMLDDPNGIMNKIGSGYQQSPGFKWQLGQSMQAGNNAAAAGGMLGSPAHQQQQMTTANGLANQDYYNYLNHALGLYGQGLQGEQGLYSGGLNAATGYGEDLAQALMSQAQLAYAGQANQNENEGGGIGSLISGGMSMAALAGGL